MLRRHGRLRVKERTIPDAAFSHPLIPASPQPMDRSLITTAFELPNHRITACLGVVRGITVRSRSVVGSIGAALQTLRGGNITLLTELCEQSRAEAFEIMIRHAMDVGATGIVAVRYDATEVMSGVTEVLCYGTAVQVAPT
jgi:uncharacterized protein YbjQ (UPF0145 family)